MGVPRRFPGFELLDENRTMKRHLFLIAAMAIPAALPAQTCNEAIRATAPDSRYTDHGDGTVSDGDTGLMWKQCSEGQGGVDCGEGRVTGYTWSEALQQAEASTHAGYGDWRLPNVKELKSLVERRCYDPAINIIYFPNTASADYWSSSPYANYSGSAWNVDFDSGYDGYGYKNYDYAVRLVRGRQ
jgi:hypothetical protein